MDIFQFLQDKRHGNPHTPQAMQSFIQAVMAGDVSDDQLGAWLMAACIQGLTLEETIALTDACVQSGETLQLGHEYRPIVDKHSTGGVGDKTTLVLVPLLASCGLKIAKLSGRGLGLTGGTLDKLEAIPGFNAHVTVAQMQQQLEEVGAVIASAGKMLAPADYKLYAVRDVTATVDNIPLITASVMSKKIATGADVIVLDIKAGCGAFCQTVRDAQALAQSCQQVGEALGKRVKTVISRMEQPLGKAVGHAVEVIEAVDTLKGNGPEDLLSLCYTLGSIALIEGGKAATQAEATTLMDENIANGKALDCFKRLVTAQGGDAEVLEETQLMPQPERVNWVPAERAGYVSSLNSRQIAEAVHMMGGGRVHQDDTLDLGVGVVLHKKLGDWVEKGEGLLELHAGHTHHLEALERVQQAIVLSDTPPEIPALMVD